MGKFSFTLSQIRECYPCASGWRMLLASRGFADGDFDPEHRVTLGDVAFSNGVTDAWWCARCLDWDDFSVRRAVISVLMLAVKRAARHTTDPRVHDCVAAVDRWSSGGDRDWGVVERMRGEVKAAQAAARSAWALALAAWTGDVAEVVWAARAAGEAARAAAPLQMGGEAAEVNEEELQARDLINAFGRTGL